MSTLFDRDRVVFNQKAKFIEVKIEHRIRDESGVDIGVIRQEGQSKTKKAMRILASLDQYLTHKLSVYEADGTKVLELTRPAKFVKSSVHVTDGAGIPVGSIVQRNVFGKIRFGLVDPGGNHLGEIRAENWRAWNFSIVDQTEHEVARITKTWEGLAKTMFTTADDFVLEMNPLLTGNLRKLAFASAAAIDIALKQDSRGLG